MLRKQIRITGGSTDYMSEKHSNHTMICPCCGGVRGTVSQICENCGARRVGEPLSPPDVRLPSLAPSLWSVGIPLLVIATFACIWIFGNDMKVLRVLMVQALGESTAFTRHWLQIDPNLPAYRIVGYDAYRLSFYLSAVLIPLSCLGLWLGLRARRLAAADASRFGGRRMAGFSSALSFVLIAAFGASTLSSIPDAIERLRARRVAATRAEMYRLHEQALRKYQREYGTYPQELSDLNRVSREPVVGTDYWERPFNYAPVSVIAARGGARGFTNYKLVSAGPDGEFGTEDDLTMIDGVIVSTVDEPDMPQDWAAPGGKQP